MKAFLRALLDALFPMRDDARIVQNLTIEELSLLRIETNVQKIHTLLPFSDIHVRACIHEVKFHENEKAIALLGSVLHSYLKTHTGNVIIPIPLSKQRRKARGYNQVERIAQYAVAGTHNKMLTRAIYRVRDTAPQTSLSKKERLSNIKDAFSVKNGTHITGSHIVLLDDVMTTGATLEAAKAALLPHAPTSITCVALAH